MKKYSEYDDILSYGTFIKNLRDFKLAGGVNSDEFNKFDNPSHLYFKPMFYFWNGDSDRWDDAMRSGGLLAPTWMDKNLVNYYDSNSAWAYLKLNNENERADKLKQFVELLSNINTYSPWYFQSIEGISDALTRSVEGELKMEEVRKKITIHCLQDSYDNRIGTLLDLYKEITWSWIHKREIIPANLRKFDMGIYIFSSPVVNMHNPGKLISADSTDLLKDFRKQSQLASINPNSSSYITSYKYIEFHNCEINYNSAASGFDTLDNIEGNSPSYNIEIYYDDCYEMRYNEFMTSMIGDVVKYDLMSRDEVDSSHMNKLEKTLHNKEELEKRSNLYDGTGFLGEIVGALKDRGEEFISQKYMGNIYGFSLEQDLTNIENFTDGKFFSAAHDIKNRINKLKSKPKFKNSNIYNKQPKEFYIEKGNIFKNKTAASNI